MPIYVLLNCSMGRFSSVDNSRGYNVCHHSPSVDDVVNLSAAVVVVKETLT